MPRRPNSWAPYIVGCEVTARIGRSAPRISNGGGWQAAGVIGGISAAAACAKLMKLPVDQVAQCHRHQRIAGVGLAGQLRHDDQAAACRQRRAQRRNGGDASRARDSRRSPYGPRRRQRLLRKLRTRAEDRLCAVQGSRQPLGSERARLQHQILSLRRARPHRDRRGADAARKDRRPHERDHQHPLLDVAVERQARRHEVSDRRRSRRNSRPPT